MYEKPMRPIGALPPKRPGRVVQLRSRHAATRQTPVSHQHTAPFLESEVIDATVHTLQNHLQTIELGVDLLFAEASDAVNRQEHQRLTQSIEYIGRLLRELQEYCVPPLLVPSPGNLANELEGIIHRVARTGAQPKRTTRVVCRTPFATVHVDWTQVRSAIERTLACAYALLSEKEGEIVVESDIINVGTQRFIEVRVQSFDVAPFPMTEDALFCPFGQINGRHLGLNLLLARRTATRLEEANCSSTNQKIGTAVSLYFFK